MLQRTVLIKLSLMLFIANHLVEAASPPCSIAFRCSDQPPLAWASDGGNCLVFQNNCHLRSQNCQRINKNQSTFEPVEREECLKLCKNTACTREFDPVCTINKNKSTTFSNRCTWSQGTCKSGEAYVFQFFGSCEPPQQNNNNNVY